MSDRQFHEEHPVSMFVHLSHSRTRRGNGRPLLLMAAWLLGSLVQSQCLLTAAEVPRGRVVFLGDSITANGGYANHVETWYRLHKGNDRPEFIALGLSSETACGLSEPDHPFPRPNVHERLDRVLTQTKPDVVVACYGMNDGIYHPYSEERFAAYQQGIRQLIDKVHAAGARIVLLTPPPYAGVVSPKPEPSAGESYGYQRPVRNYDDVLARYADWIMTLKDEPGVEVVDVRTPLLPHLNKCYGKDVIHPQPLGHEIIGESLLAHWGHQTGNPIIESGTSGVSDDDNWQQMFALVAKRRATYDEKLLWEIGHLRPGSAPPGTLQEAEQRAAQIDREFTEWFEKTSAADVKVSPPRRVFHNGEHNAFTDLCRFEDRLYLTFRSCPDGHMVHPTSSIIVLASDDGRDWQQVHRFSVPKRDTRDPHFLVIRDQLFVISGTWYCGDTSPATYDMNQQLGYAVWTDDGAHWQGPTMLEGTYGHYVWRTGTYGDRAYLCGYRKREFAETRTRAERDPLNETVLLESDNGLIWRTAGLFREEFGSETAFIFDEAGDILAISRSGGDRPAQVCRSKPPYNEWQRTDLDRQVGGPLVTRWGDRILVGGRKSVDGPARMSLYWLVGDRLEEFAELPSGGDCSYPGFVTLDDGRALVSYYSSHEQDDAGRPITAIYLVELTATGG